MKNSIQWICFVYDSYNRCSFTQHDSSQTITIILTIFPSNTTFRHPVHCRANKFLINKKIVTNLFCCRSDRKLFDIVLLAPHVLISMKFFFYFCATQPQVVGAINVFHFVSSVKYYFKKFSFSLSLAFSPARLRRGAQ